MITESLEEIKITTFKMDFFPLFLIVPEEPSENAKVANDNPDTNP